MPLQTSGSITINDIAAEFGGTTPHSLSEYYAGGGLVPAGTSGTNGAVPSSGTISLQNFYGTSNIVEFIGQLAVNTPNMYRRQIGGGLAVDGNNNFIFGGDQINGGSTIWYAKYNSSGVVQNQWQVTDGARDLVKIVTDSSNNFYVFFVLSTQNVNPGYVVKYNSSGSFVWGKEVNFNAQISSVTPDMAVDSSGNVLLCAYGPGVVYANAGQVIKLNSSGTLQWTREYSCDVTGGIATDASGNIYIAGATISGIGAGKGILKINSSGVLQWSRHFEPSSPVGAYFQSSSALQADASGNVYWFGTFRRDGYLRYYAVVKYNTSGTFQFYKSIGSTYNTDENFYEPTNGAVDSSGNIYASKSYRPGGFPNPSAKSIIKWNSLGTLEWERMLENANGVATNSPVNIAVTASHFYTVSQWYPGSGSGNSALFFKAPQDGSKKGTYSLSGSSFAYGSSGFFDQTITLIFDSTSDPDYASSATINSYTPTTVDPARTSTITII